MAPRSRRRRRRVGRVWTMGRGCAPLQPSTGSGGRRKLLPKRGAGKRPGRKRVLMYLELEKTNLIATNLT